MEHPAGLSLLPRCTAVRAAGLRRGLVSELGGGRLAGSSSQSLGTRRAVPPGPLAPVKVGTTHSRLLSRIHSLKAFG